MSDAVLAPTVEEVATLLSSEISNFNAYAASYDGAKESTSLSAIETAYTQGKRDNVALRTGLETQRIAIQNMVTTNQNMMNMLTRFKSVVADSTVQTDNSTVDALRKRLKKDRQVVELRDAQTESLENRDAANFHTSWMGLVRPMKERSRTGLFVAAIGFLLIGVFIGVYIFRTYYGGVGATPDFLPFSIFKGVGGRRIRK